VAVAKASTPAHSEHESTVRTAQGPAGAGGDAGGDAAGALAGGGSGLWTASGSSSHATTSPAESATTDRSARRDETGMTHLRARRVDPPPIDGDRYSSSICLRSTQ